MTTVTMRTDQDYADLAFAFKCIETGASREIRERVGMSQADVAKLVGVHQPHIAWWERQQRLPIRHKGTRDIDRLEYAVSYGRVLRELSERTND